MILSIISIVANVVFFVLMRIEFFTDRYVLPGDDYRERSLSALDKLDQAGKPELVYIYLFFAVICIIASILVMFGLKHSVVKIIRLVSLIASVLVFAFIMFTALFTHATY